MRQMKRPAPPLFGNFSVQHPHPSRNFQCLPWEVGEGGYGYFLELHNGKNCKLYYKLTKTFNISLVSGSTSIMSCSIADTCFKNDVYFLNFYRKFYNQITHENKMFHRYADCHTSGT